MSGDYISEKMDEHGNAVPVSGESISAVLPAGEYTITISDFTDYPVDPFTSSTDYSRFELPPIPVRLEMSRYTTQLIQGRISIPESSVTMPLSMTVRELNTATGKMKEPTEVQTLNPSNPLWVVVHGRKDSDAFDQMSALARNLSAFGVQVVTVNWNAAASSVGLDGSRWIEAVARWVSNQLKAVGFTSNNLQNLNIIGHSWGSYVAFELAQRMDGKVNAIVALDPAKDTWLLGGIYYDESQVDFSEFATTSYAFHSSFYGDRDRALTAQYAFRVEAPENYEESVLDQPAVHTFLRQHYLIALGVEVVDEVLLDPWREHGFAVTLFSSLLNRGKDPQNGVASLFTPQRISSSSASLTERSDHWEGLFFVRDPVKSTFTNGPNAEEDWWKAENFVFDGYDAVGNAIVE